MSSGSAGSSGSTGGAASAVECTASQLTIAYTDNKQIRGGALAGMSHADNVVTFTNHGSAPCQIQAIPAWPRSIRRAPRSSRPRGPAAGCR
ncbi:MAG TPA: hypothetical protein VMV92_30380 [Streptosporangiaceae bacterium]|nr:hypothetical protein [Streptosporangiaceae bacterium]